MKTSIIKILALILALVMCFGAVSCTTAGENNNGENNNGENNNGENNKPVGDMSEEELFATLKSAYEATIAYDGVFTMNVTQEQTQNNPYYDEGEEKYKSDITLSVNRAEDRYIYVEKDYYNGELSGIWNEKLFALDGIFYLCEYDQLSEDSDKEFSEFITKEQAFAYSCDEETFMAVLPTFAGGAFTADNYAELTNAFDTAVPTLLANEIAYMKGQQSITDADEITLVPTVSVAASDDGTVTINIKIALEATAMGFGSERIQNVIVTLERTFSCNDGKITSMGMDMKVSYDASAMDGTDDTVNFTMSMNLVADMVYTFDQELYSSFDASLPSDANEIKKIYEEVYIDFVFDEAIYDMYLYDTESVEGAFERIEEQLKHHFGAMYDPNTDTESYYITVNGFYKDAAFTQKIDPNSMSREEFIALKTVYVDFDIADGYAIVKREYEEKKEISRAYELIYAQIFGYGYASDMGDVRSIDEAFDLSYETDRGEDYKVFVNGQETAADSLTLENGKTYVIKYVTFIKDKNLGIGHVINFGLF